MKNYIIPIITIIILFFIFMNLQNDCKEKGGEYRLYMGCIDKNLFIK